MNGYIKKILIFAISLLILAGIIVVVLKGFNVSLNFRAHDTLKFVFEQKFEKSDVDKICKEVFKDKEYELKTVEVFTDAIYIIAPTITENEQEVLLTKLSNLYKKEENSSEESGENVEETTIFEKLEKGKDYDFYTDSKVRIRDIAKPYIIPSVISSVIIGIYIAVKYRKLHNGVFMIPVCETLGEMIIVLLSVLSLIAIIRIPFTSSVIPIVIFIMLVALMVKLVKLEKELKNVEE